ncbi:hypothetical protein ACTHGU_00435 [Chitinophagaceae bacterium MMS25-I14]
MSAQKIPEKVSPQEYYDFINSLNRTTGPSNDFLVDKPDMRYVYDDSAAIFKDTLLNPADVDFMRQQLKTIRYFKWPEGKINSVCVIRHQTAAKLFRHGVEKGWARFHRRYGEALIRYSVPLFTADRQTCIFYQSRSRGGLAGGGRLVLLKKSGGNWEVAKIMTIWVS